MKTVFTWLAYGLTAALGIKAGYYLWDEVLEDKVDDLKDRLTKKNN